MKKILLYASCLLIASCSASKFDYNTAYKFSNYQYNQQASEQLQNFQLPPTEPVASLRPVPVLTNVLPSDLALKEMSATTTEANNLQEQAVAEFMKTYQNASKAERKAIRKQVKAEYKTLRQEVKEAKQEAATNDIVFNKKMFIGVVILGAGILIAILASGAVGAVAMIVGIGLVAWGIIEQA